MHRKNKGAANKPFLFLRKVMAHFEVGFEILPGTKTAPTEKDLNDFEVGPKANPGE